MSPDFLFAPTSISSRSRILYGVCICRAASMASQEDILHAPTKGTSAGSGVTETAAHIDPAKERKMMRKFDVSLPPTKTMVLLF